MNRFPKNLLIIQAHPDDAEAWSAGTLALMAQRGWNISIATMTTGGMGSFTMKEKEVIKVRHREAVVAATEIGADYFSFNRQDGFLFDDTTIRIEAVNLIRKVNAGVVITHPPFDYHTDHRTTCTIVDAAVLLASLPNTPSEEPPLKVSPVFYHGMPFNLTNPMGDAVPEPHFFVDISGWPMDRKMAMLAHHKSQQDLMRQMMDIENFFDEMKVFNAKLGKMIGVKHAECYWQHRGGGYSRKTVIQDEISDYIFHRKSTDTQRKTYESE